MIRKLAFVLAAAACTSWAQLEVVATGLQGPQKIITTPNGSVIVSETSTAVNSGRISVVSASGSRRTLIEGLPSGTDVTGSASGPTGLALRGNRLYVAIGAGDTERRNEQGVTLPNPQGPSSTLFASVLVFDLSSSADLTTGTFRLTAADRTEVSDGYSVKLEDGVGASATVSLLARFPFAEPDRGTVYRFSNLWGMTLSGDGSILYVADASANSLLSVDTATGRWKRVVRFAQNPNPTPVGPPVIDPVPTSVRLYGDQLLVSFLTGFPFIAGAGGARTVDVASRTSTPFLTGLTTVTDVLVRQTGGDRPTFFALEFSQNMLTTPAAPGRLLRYDTAEQQVVSSELQGPVGMAWDESSKSLYVLEMSGRLQRLKVE